MKSKWITCKLSDLGEIVGGATPSTKVNENYGGSIPWITPKDLSNSETRFITRGERNITQQGMESCSTSLLPKDTVLFSSRAPIGYMAIAKNPVCTNQGFKSIIPNRSVVDPLFLYYLLKSNKDKIQLAGSGSTFKEVSGNTMRNIKVTFPVSISAQQDIAQLLNTLDSKIELNTLINKNLLDQAQAIYREWIIKKHLPPKLHDSIWKIFQISDLANIHDSKRIPLSKMEREARKKIYPYYGATSVMDYVDDYLFDGVYLLFGEDGSVIDDQGHPILQYVEGKFWVNNHAHVLSGKSNMNVELLYLILSNTNVEAIVTGAVQKKISQEKLKSIQIELPDSKALIELEKTLQPFFDKIRRNNSENERLSSLRNTLLPRLLSGEIWIS